MSIISWKTGFNGHWKEAICHQLLTMLFYHDSHSDGDRIMKVTLVVLVLVLFPCVVEV